MTASHAAVARGEHRSRLEAQIALLPTPAAQEPGGALEDYHERLRKVDGREPTFMPLSMLVKMLPTPTSAAGMGGNLSRGGARGEELLLPGLVKTFLPTPTVGDSKSATNTTAGRSNPDSKQLWSGGTLRPPSTGTKPSQDDQLLDQLTIEGV
jgi:hypothetical protein